MIRTSTFSRIVVVLATLGLAACGGGGGGSSGGGKPIGNLPPAGGTGTYSGPPKIEFFNVTPNTIGPGDTFTVSWTVDPDTLPVGTYTARFHLHTEPHLPQTDSPLGPVGLGALTRVFQVRGTLGGSGTGLVVGTDVDLTVQRTAVGGHDSLVPTFLPGYARLPFALDTRYPDGIPTLYAILEVCATGADLKIRCVATEGEAAVPLRFRP